MSKELDILNKLNENLNEELDDNQVETDPVIEGNEDPEDTMTEATKKVVQGGKVTTVKVKKGKKKKLSAKQKQALAKARKKAHSASADKSRAKSMKVRSKRMKESTNINELIGNICESLKTLQECLDEE